MARRWRKYQVGKFRLGALFNGDVGAYEAVVHYRDADGPHRRRLGVFSETEGRIALDEFVSNCQALKDKPRITVGEVWEQYLADREKDGKLVDTFRQNWKALAPRFAAMPVADITDDICRDYAELRFAKGRVIKKRNKATGATETRRVDLSPGTVWSELLRLRSCLNWAADRRIIEWAPHIWLVTKPAPRDRVMTEDEVIRLIDACIMPHVRLFVVLAITTAGRSAASTDLTWELVNIDAGTIDLRVKDVFDPLTKRVRKGRAIVVMTEEARAELLKAKEAAQTGHVIEWDEAPVKKIRKGFQAAVERAGLGKDVTPHVLRHTVLTWLDEAGIPMERISRLAGHRDINTTRTVYAKPGVDTLRPAAAVIDLRMRRKNQKEVVAA